MGEPQYLPQKFFEDHWGITKDMFCNYREQACFPFYKPKGSKQYWYKIRDIERWIEKGKVL